MSQTTSPSKPGNPVPAQRRVESGAHTPSGDDEASSSSAFARKIDNLHKQLNEVTAFLDHVQQSLKSVLALLEDVESNVLALSHQTAGRPLERLPVPSKGHLGKSLRDEGDSLTAETNQERRKKRRTDDSPQRRDSAEEIVVVVVDKPAEGVTGPPEPTEEPAPGSPTDC